MHKRIGFFLCLTGICIMLSVVLICLPFTLPRLWGWYGYTVLTGSMEPQITAGSLVWVRPCSEAQIFAGDVIGYYSDDQSGTVILHRVLEKRELEGAFLTKGDAGAAPDPQPVRFDRLIGKAVIQIPFLGAFAISLSSDLGKAISFLLVWLALGIHTAGRILCLEKRSPVS